MPRTKPLETIRARLRATLSSEEAARLPAGYFRIGDVLIVDLPLPGNEAETARAYADALGMRSVLGREGRITGEFRQPRLRLLWGDPDTATRHTESGIRYRLDPARVMWSQGNLAERQRVARWDCRDETIVDCFAGVGYFTLPLALHTQPRKVIAVEKNPEAFAYLEENIALNGTQDRVTALLGDCRERAPTAKADRVLLGYLPDSLGFVGTAVRSLKPAGGVIHVHRVVSARATLTEAFAPVQDAIADLGRRARLLHLEHVKAYGPGKSHLVLDVEVKP